MGIEEKYIKKHLNILYDFFLFSPHNFLPLPVDSPGAFLIIQSFIFYLSFFFFFSLSLPLNFLPVFFQHLHKQIK